MFGAAAFVAAVLVLGCTERNVSPPEPSAGRWRPVLLARNDTIRLRAPPDKASARQKEETAELIAFQSQRTPERQATVEFWNAGAVVRWNEIARDLVAKHRTSAPAASRVYALVSVAQFDALLAAWHHKYLHGRPAPQEIASNVKPLVVLPADPSYPSEHAAVAAASAALLTYLYPDEAAPLEHKMAEHGTSRLWAGASHRSDIAAGDSLGRDVAKNVIEHARQDRSDKQWTGRVLTGTGRWVSAGKASPLVPGWVEVKPWLMSAAAQFRAAPPPEFGSTKFSEALAEVKTIAGARTSEQARMAALWADGPGSYTPPGRWNKIAADLIAAHRLNEVRAARVLALMNMALMDAGIAYLDTQYHYLVLRPSQADASISTTAPLPNSPAYPSGHAAFSAAGAEVLGYLFPQEKAALRAKAEEAARSRVYGGIHYSFDGEAGLSQGRAIAQLAIARGRSDGSP